MSDLYGEDDELISRDNELLNERESRTMNQGGLFWNRFGEPTGWGCLLMVALFCGVLFAGCWVAMQFQPPETRTPVKVNIERVFMHQAGQYSVLVQEDGKLHSRQLGWAEVYTDVEMGAPMYYDAIHLFQKDRQDHLEKVKIHIHSAADIGGAGWIKRVGKNGHIEGQTTVVE